jgi:exodeoxyribonuclease X
MPPHRALPDAYVCGLLVLELLKHQPSIRSSHGARNPQIFTKFNFGQFQRQAAVGGRRRLPGLDGEQTGQHQRGLAWNAKREIARRAGVPQAPPIGITALQSWRDPAAATVQDLTNWYLGQSDALGSTASR